MNLRDQLKEILPDILPRNPAQAIKGTELIDLVKNRLKQDYSDATLRYHFSIMSCDPSSPIAKVEQGQGYYLRTATMHTMNSARNLFRSGDGSGEGGTVSSAEYSLAMERASKFRAVVHRYLESVGQHPFVFAESFSLDAGANRWRVPDLAAIEWLTSESDGDGPVMDRRKLEVSRRMGESPLRVDAVKLRLELDQASLLEDLYQCLSSSEWANTGELVIAAPVKDEAIAREVGRFAARYGIGVVSFGLPGDVLDDLPESAVIENLGEREFESLKKFFSVHRIAVPAERRGHDWQHVVESAAENPDFARLEGWISRCVLEERIITAREFEDLDRTAAKASRDVA